MFQPNNTLRVIMAGYLSNGGVDILALVQC